MDYISYKIAQSIMYHTLYICIYEDSVYKYTITNINIYKIKLIYKIKYSYIIIYVNKSHSLN